MRLLVRPDRKLGHVRRGSVVGELKQHVATIRAARAPRVQLDRAHVADKVRLPDAVARALPQLTLTIEIAWLAGKPIAEDKRITEDELVVVEQVHDRRRVGD